MTEIAPIDPSKIIIATQCSPVEPFKSEVIRLFKSQNLFGGNLTQAKKVACFSEPPDTDFKNELKELIFNLLSHWIQLILMPTKYKCFKFKKISISNLIKW